MAERDPRVAVLCGGTGGSRFVRALSLVLPHANITAIVNTADDDEFHGLYVSPDPDSVTYALADAIDDERGWGLRGDTFRWLGEIAKYGRETWFNIGDRDLATHLHRTRLRSEGWPGSAIVADIARAFGVSVRLLPMTDDIVRTIIETDAGHLAFQRYLVQRHAQDVVRGVRYDGAAAARPAPGMLDAIAEADAVFIAPSNPVGSIGPILAVPGVRDAVRSRRDRCVAISPIIGGQSLQPPAGEMMAGTGLPVDVTGVAQAYDGLITALIIDQADASRSGDIAARGIGVAATRTLMSDDGASRALAETALSIALA